MNSEDPVTIHIVVGTRPEIIKMSPIIRRCDNNNVDYEVIHTGQHYSDNMDELFFDNLNIQNPSINFSVGSKSPCRQIGDIIINAGEYITDNKPDCVLVQGDTNSVLACAIAGKKAGVDIGHVEAGLRSNNEEMPEEQNRILTDHISDYLFAPTNEAKNNLIGEGIPSEQITVTGNTITDAVLQNIELAEKSSEILSDLKISKGEFILLTAHRQENVEDPANFATILDGIAKLGEQLDAKIIYPIHPRSKKCIEKYNMDVNNNINLIEPCGYLDFLKLINNSVIVVTDSGGVQEETCILKTPCVTIRSETERPETVDAGANVVTGTDKVSIVKLGKEMANTDSEWDNPYGDGNASEKIIDVVTSDTQY